MKLNFQALHLSDLIDHNQSDFRVEEAKASQKILKSLKVNPILTHPARRINPGMAEDSFLSIKAQEFKTSPSAFFSNFSGNKSSHRDSTLEFFDDLFHQSGFA
jgi:hypothetical protein